MACSARSLKVGIPPRRRGEEVCPIEPVRRSGVRIDRHRAPAPFRWLLAGPASSNGRGRRVRSHVTFTRTNRSLSRGCRVIVLARTSRALTDTSDTASSDGAHEPVDPRSRALANALVAPGYQSTGCLSGELEGWSGGTVGQGREPMTGSPRPRYVVGRPLPGRPYAGGPHARAHGRACDRLSPARVAALTAGRPRVSRR